MRSATESFIRTAGDNEGAVRHNHPEQVGKYRVVGVLGQGAMGVVYKALDPVIGRQIALKTIRRDLIEEDSETNYRARLRNAARAAGSLNHSGIVGIYDYGKDDGVAYIAMELVEGRSLDQCLAQLPQFPLADALRIMTQLLDALQFAHERGILHRDIKPANLLILKNGQVKITDFGIARVDTLTLTQVGVAMGSPGFMAPEQFLGEAVDQRADLFAAAVVLYRLLTGVLPFSGTTNAIMYKICHEDPAPVSSRFAGPQAAALDALMRRALAKRPEDRYADAAQMRLALTAAAAEPDPDGTVVRAAVSAAAAEGPAWSGCTVELLERNLSTHVGPVAQVMVRRAVRHKGSAEDLIQRIEADPSWVGPPTVGAPAAGAFSAELLEHAGKTLTAHVGPIASVLLRKSVAAGGDREQLIERLAAFINSPADRARFLAQMAKVP